jgi:hypothetical protein
LNLTCDFLLSNVAFTSNLYRYDEEQCDHIEDVVEEALAWEPPEVGLSLPGARLVTRTIPAVINWCFD